VVGVQLAWQARQLRVDDPARALAVFQSNTVAGSLLFVAIVAGALHPLP
jgi:4-hydroxybenzoate polyprenyltransferase